jgi:hypothetical protein
MILAIRLPGVRLCLPGPAALAVLSFKLPRHGGRQRTHFFIANWLQQGCRCPRLIESTLELAAGQFLSQCAIGKEPRAVRRSHPRIVVDQPSHASGCQPLSSTARRIFAGSGSCFRSKRLLTHCRERGIRCKVGSANFCRYLKPRSPSHWKSACIRPSARKRSAASRVTHAAGICT